MLWISELNGCGFHFKYTIITFYIVCVQLMREGWEKNVLLYKLFDVNAWIWINFAKYYDCTL